ncbi:hypothetical protein DERP_012452 [Dermatophagoides pteronyssinus]|uniref:Uncharacterized protein n=1 Tax=Dermatophagoides pteronyssinus TaxID=6956 RepID=A0ABQ8IX25_DERPT|nr:hypothetical protein DERP_012452 [Dermatophagoides pteronyssinus]
MIIIDTSKIQPISPRRGIRLPSVTNAAIAAPSPGSNALPKSRLFNSNDSIGAGPTISSASFSPLFFSFCLLNKKK